MRAGVGGMETSLYTHRAYTLRRWDAREYLSRQSRSTPIGKPSGPIWHASPCNYFNAAFKDFRLAANLT
jgi:hypothetical protein